MFNSNGKNRTDNRLIEVSFLDLLNAEQDRVSRLNESYRALDIAKKCRLRTGEYEKDIKLNIEKISECRENIKEYLENNLNIKASL